MRKLELASLALLSFMLMELASTLFVQAEVLSQAPAFTLTDVDGQSFSLNDFRGKPVVLCFIATRSVFCEMETIILTDVNTQLNGSAAFIVIGVSNETIRIGGDTDAELRAFRKVCNFTGIIARDTQSVAEDYGVMNIPTTFVLDQTGYVLKKLVGVVDASESVLMSIVPEFSPTTVLLAAMVLCTFAVVIDVRLRPQRSGKFERSSS